MKMTNENSEDIKIEAEVLREYHEHLEKLRTPKMVRAKRLAAILLLYNRGAPILPRALSIVFSITLVQVYDDLKRLRAIEPNLKPTSTIDLAIRYLETRHAEDEPVTDEEDL